MYGMIIFEENNKYYMVYSTEYNEDFINEIHEFEDRKWDKTDKVWVVPITIDNIKALFALAKKYYIPVCIEAEYLKKVIENLKKEKEVRSVIIDKIAVEKIDDTRIFISTDDSEISEKIRKIFGAKRINNSRRNGWEIYITVYNAEKVYKLIKKLSSDNIDPEFSSWLNSFLVGKKENEQKSYAIEPDKPVKIQNLAYSLKTFQQVAVNYAMINRKIFLADDMGCGKTIEALASFEASGIKRCLVVCPNTIKYNWLAEAQKWLPHRTSVVLDIDSKTKKLKETAEINIINYDKLVKVWPLLTGEKIEFVIFDESHRLKNSKTKWSKMAAELSENMLYVLLLSGTPILNRPAELVHQLKILGRLKEFGGEWNFKFRFCDMHRTSFGWEAKGGTHLDELNKALRSCCYIRRMKSQVLKDLPSKQRSYIPIKLDVMHMGMYKKAAADIADWIINNEKERKKFFAKQKSERLKTDKHFIAETHYKARTAETLMKITKLRQIAAEAKVYSVIEWVEDFMESGKKLVLFAYHLDVIEQLRIQLNKYGVRIINGEIDDKTKQKNVEAFQKDPNVRIIICNLQAGGVGITLTAASDVAFIEFNWTPAEMLQAEDRVYRIGQENNVNIWYFYALDTIDLDMIQMLQEKDKIINEATDGLSSSTESDFLVSKSLSRILDGHKKSF